MTPQTKQIIDLHQGGMSIYQIARKYGKKPNSVLQNLRYYKILKPALGRNIEEEVAKWYENQGIAVVRQKGDAPFDLWVNRETIDVKSASRGSDGFSFQLQSLKERQLPKEFIKYIDWFYLVFVEGNHPIYKVRPSDLMCTQTLKIKEIGLSKYPLIYVGDLRGVNEA